MEAARTGSLNALSSWRLNQFMAEVPIVQVSWKSVLNRRPPFTAPRSTATTAEARRSLLSASTARVSFHLVVVEPMSVTT